MEENFNHKKTHLRAGTYRTHIQDEHQNVDAYSRKQNRNSNKKTRVHNSYKPHKRKKPNALVKLIGAWWDRILGVAKNRSFDTDIEQYKEGQTSKDFIFNAIGTGIWGMVFPILTIVVTQFLDMDKAGMFSMAFVIATLLMILANFGVRTYQISDVEEKHSFADYHVHRIITCIAALVIGLLYFQIRGYEGEMFSMCLFLLIYRALDAYADVFEGRLQQKNKLYLAGISLGVRSLACFLVFAISLFVLRNLVFSSLLMAIVAAASVLLVSFPLAKLEAKSSGKFSFGSVASLFKYSWPLFIAFFAYSLIDNMPKFMMEGFLSYDNQLLFNALYFPAQTILIVAQLVYKPLLVRMAMYWNDVKKRKKFDLTIFLVVLIIAVITIVAVWFMNWIGLAIMGFLYGVDFASYTELATIMLIAGAVTAGIDFLCQTVTVLRHQKDVVLSYVIAFIFSIFVPFLLIRFAGLEGALISYLLVMVLLFVLLVVSYVRIRMGMAKEKSITSGTQTRVYRKPVSTIGLVSPVSSIEVEEVVGEPVFEDGGEPTFDDYAGHI
ncbi:MAG: lipopolysaccharide biosynthesis protein [Coriobacteriales bacterium]|nr:lipopolysaccharide biosynthesis protein [Coriobacteriales bacterium]